tara:strand:+ start:517 stop:921 length:405 start_codon:yes stop_codon:yes gene_type:complete
MKKIIVILLLAAVPFFSYSQKRGKKTDSQNYTYMIIKAVEVPMESTNYNEQGEDVVAEANMKRALKPDVKLVVLFDYGDGNKQESNEMLRRSRSFKSIASALNAAANKGWILQDVSTTMTDNTTVHHYFMRRSK